MSRRRTLLNLGLGALFLSLFALGLLQEYVPGFSLIDREEAAVETLRAYKVSPAIAKCMAPKISEELSGLELREWKFHTSRFVEKIDVKWMTVSDYLESSGQPRTARVLLKAYRSCES